MSYIATHPLDPVEAAAQPGVCDGACPNEAAFAVIIAWHQPRQRSAALLALTVVAGFAGVVPGGDAAVARAAAVGRPRRRAGRHRPLAGDGIDEPRLVKLARDLSAGGLTVLTPELPDLSRPPRVDGSDGL